MTTRRQIGRSRGFSAVAIRDRGPIGRGLKAGFNAASKTSWFRTAVYFHSQLRERRFDPQHQEAAGFAKRKGQGIPKASKAYRRSYTGKKESRFGHTRALELTGDTRRAMKSASISSTSNRGRAAYSGASKFSFRHPKSRIRMHDEFRRLLDGEIIELAQVYDEELDQEWKPEQ